MHPAYEMAIWCDLPTKKACDERYRGWQRERKATVEAGVAARKAAAAEKRELAYQEHERLARERHEA